LKTRKNTSSNDFSQRRKLSSDQARLGPYSLAEDMFIKTQTGKIGQLTKLPGNQYKKRSQDRDVEGKRRKSKKKWGRREAPVQVGLRGKKEEQKRNGGERGGLCTKGRRREMRGVGGLVGTGKRDEGGYVLKFNWVWGICGERKKMLG
jgi:hypothetical protein